MTHTYNQILDRVRTVIAETLRIPLEDVDEHTYLGQDLGAESIDLVDIIFRLESEYKVSIYVGGLIEKLSEVFGVDALSQNGILTELGARLLRGRKPEIDPERIDTGISVVEAEGLYTTTSWVRMIKEILEARPQTCPNCNSDKLTAVSPSVLCCEACNQEITCPTQEDLLIQWAKEVSKELDTAKLTQD